MNRIMIVDDDLHIRELMRASLRNEGFEVCEASDGRDALEKMAEVRPDLCVVDIMMPNMDGFELCRNLRRYYEELPILILSARSETGQKVKGFDLGADDYLTKPFELAELVARIRALLKRYRIASSQVVQIGALTVDKNSYAVSAGGTSVDIPMKEFELLFRLGGCPGKTVPRDRLIEDVWGLDFEGNERTLDVHINRLRDRFPQDRFRFRIVTIRGLGYRLEVMP